LAEEVEEVTVDSKERIYEVPREGGQPWVLDLPTRLVPGKLQPFTGFILGRLRERLGSTSEIDLVTRHRN